MTRWVKFLFISLCTFCFIQLYGQDKSELEKKKQFLLDEIENAEQSLKIKQKNKSGKLEELKSLSGKIKARKSLIGNIRTQIEQLDDEINTISKNIFFLEEKILMLKDEYAKMIRSAYKQHNDYNTWIFLFSAESFNDGIKRLQYLRYYSDYRQRQYGLIEKSIDSLSVSRTVLEDIKVEKQSLLSEKNKQRNLLLEEEKNQKTIIKQIEGEESSLKKEISKKKASAKKLEDKIAEIIRKEIAAAAAKNKAATGSGSKANTPTKKASEILNLTPEAKLLSSSFEKNKGKLPWPVERGYISERFGEHAHAYLKNIKVNNNGINISTDSNSKVRSMFEGDVLNVVFIPGAQAAVIIRHGKYFSVYSNLKEVFVKTGDKVQTKEAIGVVHTDEKENKTEVHLEIWKGTSKLNPGLWLIRK